MLRVRRDLTTRFMENISKQSNGCWLWTSTKWSNGYGMFNVYNAEKGKYCGVLAHRFAWGLDSGKMPPKHLNVCHKCDVKECVNPEHLFLGTAKDNIDDCHRKGRHSHGERHSEALRSRKPYYRNREFRQSISIRTRGEGHGLSKLTTQKVLEIRKLYASGQWTQARLATRFRVGQANISRVINRKMWSHV